MALLIRGGQVFRAELAPYLSTACRATAAAPYPINRDAAPVG